MLTLLSIFKQRDLEYSHETAKAQLGLESIYTSDDNISKKDFRIEHYNLGNIHGYIEHDDIPGENNFIDAITVKLEEKGEDIILLGYGQSGAGKTSALIFFTGESTPGLIIKAVNKLKYLLDVELKYKNCISIGTNQ